MTIELARFDPTNHTEHWFVVFSSNFSHVWAVKPAAYGAVLINNSKPGLFVDYVDEPFDAVLVAIIEEGNRILMADGHYSGYIPRGLQTCVSVVKALLGLRAWHIITPRQLYRYLVGRGATAL